MKLSRLNFPIGPVLEHYGADLSRVRHGGWSKIRCPFHPDSSPSATVNLSINRFHCWAGCTDRTQDAVGLIQHAEGLDFLAALAEAERITGQERGEVREQRSSRPTIFDKPWD